MSNKLALAQFMGLTPSGAVVDAADPTGIVDFWSVVSSLLGSRSLPCRRWRSRNPARSSGRSFARIPTGWLGTASPDCALWRCPRWRTISAARC